ncbi:hypothetical protein B0T17DRAFT_599441 [Bombardia bombarda]|uniref:Uncharacterized protein n=1 Tax=Bombardia bombarda TaxID=252184 RepID=A0AA39X022_9PEZI|nr:hypothetical protein B0T17DRAFT_599441 [Bombardia bombarda]
MRMQSMLHSSEWGGVELCVIDRTRDTRVEYFVFWVSRRLFACRSLEAHVRIYSSCFDRWTDTENGEILDQENFVFGIRSYGQHEGFLSWWLPEEDVDDEISDRTTIDLHSRMFDRESPSPHSLSLREMDERNPNTGHLHGTTIGGPAGKLMTTRHLPHVHAIPRVRPRWLMARMGGGLHEYADGAVLRHGRAPGYARVVGGSSRPWIHARPELGSDPGV